MIKALKRLTALLFVIVFACLSGCAGQTEKREIDYTFTKNNAASFIDDYLAEENPAIGSLVEKINAAEITENSETGKFELRVFQPSLHSRFYPVFNYSGSLYLHSLNSYSMLAGKINYIKVIDEETICLTTKLDDDEIGSPALLNMIFKRKTYKNEGIEYWHPTYQKYTENTDYCHFLLESYVTSVKLSKNDYKKIRVGDPAKKVYDIDNSVLWDISTSRGLVSFRVLSEGILAIRFERVDEKLSDTGTILDNLKVTEINFTEYRESMPEYYLGKCDFYKTEDSERFNELYFDFSINSADQVEFFDYK